MILSGDSVAGNSATATPTQAAGPQATAQNFHFPTSTPGPAIDNKLLAQVQTNTVRQPSSGSIRGDWRLESNLLDSSGNNNNGTANPSGSDNYIPGACGGFGLTRDGQLLPVRLTNNTLTITGGQMSLEGWVKSPNYGIDYHHIIDNLGGYALSIVNGHVGAFFRDPGQWWAPTNTPLLSLNQWHYVVATYDSNSQVALYLDGQLIANQAASLYSYHGTEKVSIGGVGDGGASYLFNGVIDNVRVRDYTLTAQQVADSYSACQTGQPPSQVFAANECPFCDNRERVHIIGPASTPIRATSTTSRSMAQYRLPATA